MQTLTIPYLITGGVLAIPVVVCFVLSIVGQWKIFTKAGIAGWKAIVPFYKQYNLFKMSWSVKFFWLWMAAAIVSSALHGSDNTTMVVVYTVFAIICGIMELMMNFRLAKAFGKGVGFGVLLWALPFVGTLILGFGSAEYVGTTEQQKA